MSKSPICGCNIHCFQELGKIKFNKCAGVLKVAFIARKKGSMTDAYFGHIFYDQTDFACGLYCPKKTFLTHVDDGFGEKEEPPGFQKTEYFCEECSLIRNFMDHPKGVNKIGLWMIAKRVRG